MHGKHVYVKNFFLVSAKKHYKFNINGTYTIYLIT